MNSANVVEQTTHNDGWITTIMWDEDSVASNPRDYDNIATMVCAHDRYNLGDTQTSIHYLDELLADIAADEGCRVADIHYDMLSLYDHGGLSISLGASSGWDTGIVGIIYVTRQRLATEYADHHPVWYDRLAAEIFAAEVNEYDMWLQGDVYGYMITDPDGREVDSLWGIIGWESVEREMAAALAWKRKHYIPAWVDRIMAHNGNELVAAK